MEKKLKLAIATLTDFSSHRVMAKRVFVKISCHVTYADEILGSSPIAMNEA